MTRLQPFKRTDYEMLIAWVNTAEALMQFAGPAFSFPLTPEQLDLSLSDTNRFAFNITYDDPLQPIGHAEIYLTPASAFLGRIMIGDETLRGKGIGLQAVKQLLHYAFVELNREIAELNVFDWNAPAIKCYLKAGFTVTDKKFERTVNGKTWTALNMRLDKTKWFTLH